MTTPKKTKAAGAKTAKKVASAPKSKTKEPAENRVRLSARDLAAKVTAASAEEQRSAKVKKLSAEMIEELQERLLALRAQLSRDVASVENEMLGRTQKDATGDLSGYGIHLADAATDNYEKELALRIAGNEQEVLYDIEDALARIEEGKYGYSELSGKFIGLNRLRAVPYARFTLEEAEQMERKKRSF